MTGEDCSDSSTATSNGYSGSPAMDTAGFAGSMEVSSAVYPIATESHGDSEEDSGGEVGWRPTDTIKRGSAMDEEKIFVTVRIRPLNSKEICSSDELAWECPDNKTVVCLYNRPDRHFPQSYTFDEVFGPETHTRVVYERGAKDVALSALTGKNATIFAYGQTCSGKTYTMSGITENAADDIFSYIKEHDDQIFILKFSALEIYNEVASDLLNPESGPLRIMDDPERGTVIEKLVEETIRDKSHLLSLLAVCEAHRQVGETVLNDISSRSHQIIRLTIESSPKDVTDDKPIKTLVAALNFVDLAGSERASLTQSEGTTLKEGCYINRSLLTLSTVIRKLSDPNRSKTVHIPYRESKLTRILSNALGGNARTAIICTMSPSNRHVDQTRYTLFFASCAKEVMNRARVNVVISEKDLIKQLKKEVATLEAELRRSSISSQASINELLLEKDLQIQKMQNEMQKALQQRDFALSQLDDYRQGQEETKKMENQVPNTVDSMTNTYTPNGNTNGFSLGRTLSSGVSRAQSKSLKWKDQILINGNLQIPMGDLKEKFGEKQSSASAILLEEIYKLEHLQNELAQDANRALEVVQKEVECLCLTQTDMNQEAAESVAKLQAEISEIYESRVMGAKSSMLSKGDSEGSKKFYSLKDEIRRVASEDRQSGRESFQEILTNMHITFGELGLPSSQEQLGKDGQIQDKGNQALVPLSDGTGQEVIQLQSQTQIEESIRSVYAFVSDMKEKMSKLQYQKQLLLHRVLELERNGNTDEDGDSMAMTTSTSPERWKSEFSTKQRQIFELWDMCNVSIIHRSQFYLLFRGDYADKIYLEVELRRLTWLKSQQSGASVNNTHKSSGSHIIRSGEQVASPASSMRILKRERESLIKYMNTRLTGAERQELYLQWGIPLETKQRKVKLAHMVWTKSNEEAHVKMSAELVARLVTLWNKNGPVSKEMFQLSFSAPQLQTERTIWSPISSLFKAL